MLKILLLSSLAAIATALPMGYNAHGLDAVKAMSCGDNEEDHGRGCVCIHGFEKVDGVCKAECGRGETRNREGECEAPPALSCGDNEEERGGHCVCSEGFEKVGRVCKAECGRDETRNHEGECEAPEAPSCDEHNEEPDRSGRCVCSAGFERVDGACVAKCGRGETRNHEGHCEVPVVLSCFDEVCTSSGSAAGCTAGHSPTCKADKCTRTNKRGKVKDNKRYQARCQHTCHKCHH